MNKETDSSIKNMMLDSNTAISQYVSFIINSREEFYECISQFIFTNTSLNTTTLGKILACVLAVNDRTMAEQILSSKLYKLPEVLKACEILDSRRLYVQLGKKLNNLTKNGKIGAINCKINNLLEMNDCLGNSYTGINLSLTKSKAKMIKKYWINKILPDKLEFYALSYGLEHWKNLANMLHIKPSDFTVNWFLEYVYGKEAPRDSIVYACKNINDTNVLEMTMKFKPDYNFLRQTNVKLNNASRAIISTYTDVNILLWWLNEFADSEDSLEIINNRFIEDENVMTLPYGVVIDKLFFIENLLRPQTNTRSYLESTAPMIQTLNTKKSNALQSLHSKLLNMAERLLKKYSLKLKNTVVFGDASSSMEVAIKTSSIITSILCAICNAELQIFRTKNEHIKNPPKTVDDVIKFNKSCKASDMTSPAASLDFYYSRKQKVGTIIIVTDEEENTPSSGMMFSQMFDKYCKEMNFVPKLIFVSFLNKGNNGKMYTELKNKYPQYVEYMQQHIFDVKCPDLTKLDSVLNKLAMLQELE